MEYLVYLVGAVLLIYVAVKMVMHHLNFWLTQVCLNAHTALSFERVLGESAAVRLLTQGGESVLRFLGSRTFSAYCRFRIPGHNFMLLSRAAMTETAWQVYMAINLLHLLAANSFVKMEVKAFSPEEILARWGEIEDLPQDVKSHFFIWLNAIENGAVILYPDGTWEMPPPTLDVLLVRKLPRGDGRKDPEGAAKSPFEPQFAL